MEHLDMGLPLRLICSDELGSLKAIQTPDGTRLDGASVVATWGQPDKSHAASCLQLSGTAPDCAVLATARSSGVVDILNPCSGDALGSVNAAGSSQGSNGSTSSSSPPRSSSSSSAAAVVQGLHWLWPLDSPAAATVPAHNGTASGTARGSPEGIPLPSLLSVTRGGCARVHAAASEQQQQPGAAWEEQRSWQVPANVCCTAYDPGSGLLAVGCEGTELRVFDVATGQLSFSAKGGRPNKVGLVDRPWNTALTFLPASCRPAPSGGSGDGSGSVVLAGTGYHKLRLYDTRAGKRPQADLAFGEARITALAPESDGLRCWVGTGQGQLEVLDLRAMKMAGGIRGIAGSIRSLAIHPHRPLLASVGLDRFLRLHDTRTRAPLAKVYLKQQLTGVQFCPVDAPEVHPGAQQQAGNGVADNGAGIGTAAEGEGAEAEELRRQRRERKEKRKKEGAGKEGRERRARKGRAAAEA